MNIRKIFDQIKAQVEAFFAKKERLKFYHVSGYDSYSEGKISTDCWLSLSDENVA